MGEKTGISWCDHTFNPWIGCTKVSAGCEHCYAERDNNRYKWVDRWGPNGTRKRTSVETPKTYSILVLLPLGKSLIYGCLNIRLGTTAEDQEQWDKRVPVLLRTLGKIFVSVEPMLSPVTIINPTRANVDWIICGGESGPGARPMNLGWARNLYNQCREAGVPFFFKQVGGTKRVDGHWGGDLLDGVRYQEFPK